MQDYLFLGFSDKERIVICVMKTFEKLLLGSVAILAAACFTVSCDKGQDVLAEEGSGIIDLINAEEEKTIVEDNKDAQPYVFPETRLSLSEEDMKNIVPGNDFTFKYFAKEYKDAKNHPASILSSPFSVQVVCGMMGNQIDDNSALCKMLGIDGDINDVNSYFNKIIKDVENIGGEAKLTIANAFMKDVYAKSFPDDFISRLKDSYLADYLEFEAKTIEEQPCGERPEDLWVKDKTEGMIDSAPEAILSKMASLFNVLCFKGTWVDKFDSKNTWEGGFYIDKNTVLDRLLMTRTGSYPLYKGDAFSALSMPMGDGSYHFTIILPKTVTSLDAVVESLNANVWNTIREKAMNQKVALMIPRFSLSFNEDAVLKYVDRSFLDSYYAQMESMGMGDLRVSRVKQKAKIDVDEDGTAAAVVTQAIICTASGSGPQIETFAANHPFVFIISEAGSGLVLFMGTYSG